MKLLTTLLALGITTCCSAQLSLSTIPFEKANGQVYKHLNVGGLDHPQFSETDLDNDGKKDIVIFDRQGNKIICMLNKGNTGQTAYEYAPSYEANFPQDLEHWILLRDYDCDGLEDIFSWYQDPNTGMTGIRVHRASRQNNQLSYTVAENIITYNTGLNATQVNLLVSSADYPAISDVDGDGDLDILTFNQGGSHVDYYENQSVESTGNCSQLSYKLVDNCWGRFIEGGTSSTIQLSSRMNDCAGWSGWVPLPRHAGSTLLNFDYDRDGDQDLFLGDLSASGLTFLHNAGNVDTAFMAWKDSLFPSYNLAMDLDIFVAGFYLDVNNDGQKDLLAATNTPNNSENRAVLYYQNVGVDKDSFIVQSRHFLLEDIVDVGSHSAPCFVDYNGDGLVDILVGNSHLRQQNGQISTQLFAFKNIGTSTQARFALEDEDFAQLAQYSLSHIHPTTVDIDNDGDSDLFLGLEDGKIAFLENRGSAQSPSFPVIQVGYESIDVGQYAKPFFYDIDKDGAKDLLIGSRQGNICYYPNRGTATSADYSVQETNFWGGVNVKQIGSFEGYASPCVYPQGSVDYLVVGAQSGKLLTYEIDLAQSSFLQKSNDLSAVDLGARSTLAIADINADNIPELLCGNARGGLSLYTGAEFTSVRLASKVVAQRDFAFPNPVNNQLIVSTAFLKEGSAALSIYTLEGTLIKQQRVNKGEYSLLDVSTLSAGIYILELQSDKTIYTQKLLKNK